MCSSTAVRQVCSASDNRPGNGRIRKDFPKSAGIKLRWQGSRRIFPAAVNTRPSASNSMATRSTAAASGTKSRGATECVIVKAAANRPPIEIHLKSTVRSDGSVAAKEPAMQANIDNTSSCQAFIVLLLISILAIDGHTSSSCQSPDGGLHCPDNPRTPITSSAGQTTIHQNGYRSFQRVYNHRMLN